MIDPSKHRLLLACVKARWDLTQLDEARRIVHECAVDWDEFLHQAARHAVAPLIHDALKEEDAILPDHVKEKLATAYYHTALHNTLLYERLAKIVDAFNRAEVPVILLKGAALAQQVYGNVALRPMSDLDFLVRKEKMSRAERLLVELGYEVRDHAHPYLRHATFAGESNGTRAHIEVHRHIVSSAYYRRTIPDEWLWQHASESAIGDVTALMLSPERAIAHSCLHLLDHVGTAGTLLWLCDIREISQRREINWETLADKLIQFKIALPAGSMLFACSRLLDLPLSDHVRQRLLTHQPGFLEKKAYQFCLSPARSSASKTFFDFLAVEGISARVQYLRSRLLPDRDYMMARYSIRHPWLVPLYYLRLIAQAAFDSLRAVTQPRQG